MLFPEEHTAHLKKWIVTRLENTSDADPDVLADYVLALLRHDGDINDVRRLCEEEIPDFLKEDSPVFVNDVFEALAYRSYLPGAPPPPPKHVALPAPSATGQFPPNLYYDDDSMGAAPAYPPRFQNGSKKRGYTDWDDPMAQNGRDPGFGARAFKQPRRGGRGPRPEDMNTFGGGAPGMAPYPMPGQLPPQGPPGPATVGYFDPKGAMDAMFGLSLAASHPMPEMLRGQFPPKKRKKCRDWEKKGYCPRGTNCMFAHSNDPGYPPLPGAPFGGMQALPQPPPVEEYDPSNALMPDLFGAPGPFQGQPPMPDFGQQPRHRGGKHQNRQRRGERAPFSADGPVFDRTKSTIVVENIPEDNFTEDQVKDFFSQFGNILEVSMQPYKRLAIVKFDSWNSANAAYQSPKVMFDNRFVKVFWHKDEGSKQPNSTPFAGGAQGAKKPRHTNGLSTVDDHDAGPKSEVDVEEFTKQQEEKQKAFEEKTKKREELERQREELEKRQKELIAKQVEEKAKLEAKLGGHNGIKSDDGESESKKPISQSEALRAQLEALEAEARQMGLDPDAIDAPSPWPPRGGYGGRGRGNWRGSASPYPPRGSHRGNYRGRADVHAAYAAYSLDNRPKKVILTGVDFTASDKDETLRQYLFGIGEFTDIQTTPTSAEITFKDRKTAEKFFNSVLLANKEIPGLNAPSQLDLSWAGSNGASGSVPTTPGANGPTPSSTSRHLGAAAQGRNGTSADRKHEQTTTTTTTSPSNDHDHDHDHDRESGDEDGDHDAATAAAAAGVDSSDKDVHITLERPSGDDDQHHHHGHHHHNDQQQRDQMDYEADEEQWGY